MQQYFSGAAAAKVTQQGTGYSAGTEIGKGYAYNVLIKRNTVEKTRQGLLFLSKQEILATNEIGAKPGDIRDYKVWMSQETALGNLRGLCHAIMGYDEIADKIELYGARGRVQQNIDALLNFMVDESNPFEGVEVKLQTVLRMSKKLRPGATEPSSYCFHSWSPVVTATTAALREAAFKVIGL